MRERQNSCVTVLQVVTLSVLLCSACRAEESCDQTNDLRAAEAHRQDLVRLLLTEVEDHRYEPCGTGTNCNTHIAAFAQQIAEIDSKLGTYCPGNSVWRSGVEGMIEPREQPDGTLYLYADDPDRQSLYGNLIADRLDDVDSDQESLEAIMTMGAPGSGKSHVLGVLGLCQGEVVVVDPDRFKTDLVEYQVGRAAHDRLAADRVHRESSMLAKRLRDEAIASHRDLCIDGVMSKKDAALEVIRRLQSHGYEVTVVAAVVPLDVSYQRVLSRGEQTGRFVPYDFAKQAHEKIEQHRDEILRTADRGYAFDTSVSIDEAPRLLVHYENGAPVKIDKGD